MDDTIRIKNGYAKEWIGEMQVSAGRYGHLEVVEELHAVFSRDDNSKADSDSQ